MISIWRLIGDPQVLAHERAVCRAVDGRFVASDRRLAAVDLVVASYGKPRGRDALREWRLLADRFAVNYRGVVESVPPPTFRPESCFFGPALEFARQLADRCCAGEPA